MPRAKLTKKAVRPVAAARATPVPAVSEPALAQKDRVLSAWLQKPAALYVLALLVSLFAMHGNSLTAVYGQLYYKGEVHQNVVTYETQNVVNFTNAAAESLREGNLLLRECSWVGIVAPPAYHRYPLFQFYGNLPYMLSGLLAVLGLTAHTAFLFVGFLFFTLGFVGAYRLARLLGFRAITGLVAGVAFTLAPYHLTQWHGRIAFTEAVGLGMLPWVLYGMLRCARERGLRPFLLAAGLWCALILTHTILHIYGAIFLFAVVSVQWLFEGRWDFKALLRPFAAYAFGFACAAWMIWPIVRFGPQFGVTNSLYPQDWAHVSSLKILFAPTFDAVPMAGFIGLQIGWLFIAAWAASLALLWRKPWVLPYAIVSALCVFIAWSPFDFWKHLGPLTIIQFPYRVLAFIITLGTVLLALSWDHWVRKLEGVAFAVFLGVAALIGNAYIAKGVSPYPLPEINAQYSVSGLQFQGPRYPYTLGNPDAPDFQAHYPTSSYDLSAISRTATVAEGVDVSSASALTPSASVKFGRWVRVNVQGLKKGDVIQLPAPWYPSMYAMKLNGRSVTPGRVGNRLAIQVEVDGDQAVEFHFRGMPMANAVSYLSWLLFLFLAYKAWKGESRTAEVPVAEMVVPTVKAKKKARPVKTARRG